MIRVAEVAVALEHAVPNADPVLDPGGVAADDALLLLWATWPNLIDAIAVGTAWGFTYKTLGFCWVKMTATGQSVHTGLGYYTRANSEPCLLFTRGNVNRTWIKSRGVSQIIMEDERQSFLPGFEETVTERILAHSAKPETFYQRIERLVDGPYLELFGRHPRPGWTVLGNAIDGLDIRESLSRIESPQPVDMFKAFAV